jgi:hypothetical protein
MRQTVGFLACVASASAFLSGPAAVPGTARYTGAVNTRSGVGLRVARPAVALRKNNAAALSMQTKTGIDTAALAKAANEARGLAMDSIAAAHSGHLGLPLGCAEVLALSLCSANSFTTPIGFRCWHISFPPVWHWVLHLNKQCLQNDDLICFILDKHSSKPVLKIVGLHQTALAPACCSMDQIIEMFLISSSRASVQGQL